MSSERYEEGMAIRREVLGADHVEQAMQATDKYVQPLQDLINEFAWGSIWTREGLTTRTRSLLTIAMLVALGREPELRRHIAGALRIGCTADEVFEVLVHAIPFCGFPASLAAVRAFREVLAAKS